jgi:hypothetical protein
MEAEPVVEAQQRQREEEQEVVAQEEQVLLPEVAVVARIRMVALLAYAPLWRAMRAGSVKSNAPSFTLNKEAVVL